MYMQTMQSVCNIKMGKVQHSKSDEIPGILCEVFCCKKKSEFAFIAFMLLHIKLTIKTRSEFKQIALLLCTIQTIL